MEYLISESMNVSPYVRLLEYFNMPVYVMSSNKLVIVSESTYLGQIRSGTFDFWILRITSVGKAANLDVITQTFRLILLELNGDCTQILVYHVVLVDLFF